MLIRFASVHVALRTLSLLDLTCTRGKSSMSEAWSFQTVSYWFLLMSFNSLITCWTKWYCYKRCFYFLFQDYFSSPRHQVPFPVNEISFSSVKTGNSQFTFHPFSTFTACFFFFPQVVLQALIKSM